MLRKHIGIRKQCHALISWSCTLFCTVGAHPRMGGGLRTGESSPPIHVPAPGLLEEPPPDMPPRRHGSQSRASLTLAWILILQSLLRRPAMAMAAVP